MSNTESIKPAIIVYKNKHIYDVEFNDRVNINEILQKIENYNLNGDGNTAHLITAEDGLLFDVASTLVAVNEKLKKAQNIYSQIDNLSQAISECEDSLQDFYYTEKRTLEYIISETESY